MAFQPINVEANPAALRELERLGISLVPALVEGDHAFHGWNPRELAKFLRVKYVEAVPLAPGELARRLDRILEAAQRALLQVPPEQLGMTAPGRKRTVRELGYHLFRLSLAYRDGLETGQYPESWLQETPPAELADAAAIVEYGQRVRRRLADLLRQTRDLESFVHTYYGTQTAHELLERTVWHAAQHLRQLYALLERMGETPQDSLDQADFQDLPLPKEVLVRPCCWSCDGVGWRR